MFPNHPTTTATSESLEHPFNRQVHDCVRDLIEMANRAVQWAKAFPAENGYEQVLDYTIPWLRSVKKQFTYHGSDRNLSSENSVTYSLEVVGGLGAAGVSIMGAARESGSEELDWECKVVNMHAPWDKRFLTYTETGSTPSKQCSLDVESETSISELQTLLTYFKNKKGEIIFGERIVPYLNLVHAKFRDIVPPEKDLTF